jgi:tetratricopeptide (TPR) repeat protein
VDPRGLEVVVHGGKAAELRRDAIELDLGTSVPTALGGLRNLLRGLKAVAPGPTDALARDNPSVWNRFFPSTFAEAPDLSQLALSPSERRLHRESEQTFWLLNFAAKATLEALKATGRPLVLRHTGQTDLVSLRALMRASERAAAEGISGTVCLLEWNARGKNWPKQFEATYQGYRESLLRRMHAQVHPGESAGRDISGEVPEDTEHTLLLKVGDEGLSAEERVAAAVVAIKATFFTTNYEGAMWACETGLSLLDRAQVNAAKVQDRFRALDTFETPAIEISAGQLETAREIRSVFLRSMGVVRSFTGNHDGALATFAQGLEHAESPVSQATLRMYRALTLIKKMGQAEAARGELDQALEGLKSDTRQEAQLEAGWLRNVRALTYFSEKQYGPALEDEKRAIAAVGSLHDLSATHLKINLISNISVLQEASKKYPDALKTWHRFDDISGSWGEPFFKHHRYRSAGLNLLAGNKDLAKKLYQEAYDNAVKLKDAFHRQVISSELGRMFWDEGNKDDAAHWYDIALQEARTIGDPFRTAESLLGQMIATGQANFAPALEQARLSTTHPKQAARLIQAAQSGDASTVTAVLPSPKSKLNRPFDLVNLSI